VRSLITLGVVASLPLLICGGCGDAKIDGSSPDAFKSSVERAKAGMDPAKAAKFDQAVKTLMLTKVIHAKGSVDQASGDAKLKEVFDGKTADDVIAEADKVSAGSKAQVENPGGR
jgi:hypothetical protein